MCAIVAWAEDSLNIRYFAASKAVMVAVAMYCTDS